MKHSKKKEDFMFPGSPAGPEDDRESKCVGREPKITILTNGVPRQQKIMCVGVEAENDEEQERTMTQ